MQLSVSNIAWNTAFDEAAADLLAAEGVHCIDIAPGKYFPNFAKATNEDMARVRRFWTDRDIRIVGMQSLLFGTKGLNLFDPSAQPAMHRHLQAVRRLAVGLGVERLTFGSPKNRDRTRLTDAEADAVAKDFFRHWHGEIKADSVKPCLLLEPNPTLYGTNFLTTTEAAAEFVQSLSEPSVGLQLDLGTMTVNGESPDVIDRVAPLVGHIHVSEPRLVPVGTTQAPHAIYASHLKKVPAAYLTIEMVEKDAGRPLDAVREAIRFVKRIYAEILQ